MASIILGSLAKTWGVKPFLAGVMALAGNVIDQSLFAQRTTIAGSRLSDLKVTTSSYGVPINRAWGLCRLGGNIIYASDFHERVETHESGGKGGGGSVTTTEYFYSVDVAFGICAGPIASIGRVWADGNEITLTNVTHRIYLGTENQMPDTFLEGVYGAGNVPAFRGLAYIMFQGLELKPYGNRIPQFTFEVGT